MAIKCCYGCVAPKRQPGCHSKCPEYLQESAEHNRQKAIYDRQRAIKGGLTSQTLKGVNRANKARKKAKGLKG